MSKQCLNHLFFSCMLPSSHPNPQSLRVEPSAAFMHRLALAFQFAQDARSDVSLQLGLAAAVSPMDAVRDAGALMLVHALESAAAGRSCDAMLPALALHYPGATRLDAFLVHLRAADGGASCAPLAARQLLADGTYAHPYADRHVQAGRLFNPGYAPELLAELAAAQQFQARGSNSSRFLLVIHSHGKNKTNIWSSIRRYLDWICRKL